MTHQAAAMLSCTAWQHLRTQWGSDVFCTYRPSGHDAQRHGLKVFLQDFKAEEHALVQRQWRVLEEAHAGSRAQHHC
jgi:hypothetical protein